MYVVLLKNLREQEQHWVSLNDLCFLKKIISLNIYLFIYLIYFVFSFFFKKQVVQSLGSPPGAEIPKYVIHYPHGFWVLEMWLDIKVC